MKSAIALLAVMLTGCASSYKLSEQQENLIRTMSLDQAHTVLQAIAQETPQQGGLCATNANWIRSEPKVLGFDGSKVRFIDYQAYLISAKPNIASFGKVLSVDVETNYGLEAKAYYFDFKDITKIRLVGKGVMQAGGRCMRSANSQPLGVENKNGVFVNLDVPKDKLDEVLAAIIKLAPQASVSAGIGR